MSNIDGFVGISEKDNKIIFEEDTANFYIELIKEYTDYYKSKYNKDEKYNLLTDIDISKYDSTNHILELFYNELYEYKLNENKNQEINKIYEYDEIKDENEYDKLYIIMKNGKPYKLSQSFFSLLIELVNCRREEPDETILKIMNLK